MRVSRRRAALMSVMIACALMTVSCARRGSTVTAESLCGDYLFDAKESYAVFYTTVYERDGALYAQSELVDYPVEMTKRGGDPPTYRIRFKSKGDFDLVFSSYRDGRYRTLTMKDNESAFRLGGARHEGAAQALREYHSRSGERYRYRRPLQLEDGLRTGSADEAGIDTTALCAMMNTVFEEYPYIHSILVVKDGMLVVEEYFNGWDPPRMHRLQSVTKSYTSTLVGIAIEQGLIGSVDDPVCGYLPSYDSLLAGAKREIRIRDLLTMSAGFEWNEGATYYAAPEKCDAHLADASGDYIGYVLAKPLADAPGERFEYNSGYPNILGHIIVQRSGRNILEFAFEHLFDPLGVERAQWMPIYSDREYRPGCAGGLKLTSRDMAKYGLLYLCGGEWNGKRIIGNEWVRESTAGRLDSGYGTRYGYLWKTIPTLDGRYGIFFASGTGGQYIACIPGLDAVVVTTAAFNTDKGDAVAMLLLEKLIPAISRT
jgi:CubicO group peptidase (beta-lactamase class C family)